MTERSSSQNGILILGGGPAGGAVALGLRRLGYSVTLVAEARPFLTVGGISEQTVRQMKQAGFSFALRDLPEPCDKLVCWNKTLRHSSERLINSNEVDRGILLDLHSAGITVIEARVGKITAFGSGYQIEVEGKDGLQILEASFLVEARGRASPNQGLDRVRGHQTLVLQYFWQEHSCQPGTVLQSFPQGVAWLATWFDGSRYLNLSMDTDELDLGNKQAIREQGQKALQSLEHILPMCPSKLDSCAVHARSGTATLTRECVADNWIRVGDAALAVDGVIDSSIGDTLSAVAVVPAVINTLIQKPANAEVAKAYYQNWLEHQFYCLNRKNYQEFQEEQLWSMQPFWYKRHQWPERWPVPVAGDGSELKIDLSQAELSVAPVLKDGYIEMDEVVITETQPLGIQALNGVPLVAMLKALRLEAETELSGFGSNNLDDISPEHQRYLSLWLKHRTA